jgi:AcrR family transcriptional regulator
MPREDRYRRMRDERRGKIMRAAVSIATTKGYRTMTRDEIAAAAGCSAGLINHEFGTMDGLREAVMREAVDNSQLDIVAQGLADGHAIAKDAPADMKEAAVRALA